MNLISALIADAGTPGGHDLAADLSAAGVHVLGAFACDNLVREAIRQAPDVVVCWAPAVPDELFGALQRLRENFPRPVVVFTDDMSAEALERALQQQVQAWVVQGYGAHRLRPLLQLAQARFARERALHDALADVTHRYEERKLVDRAKGILMHARQIPEDEAFRLLRLASMQGKQRVGQVAQHVIEAARDAQAVNRAGQLRMLSQRMLALHALVLCGADASVASARLAQAIERAGQQIEALQQGLSQPTFGDLLQAVAQAFDSLRQRLSPPKSAPAEIAAADAAAEQLLRCADRLTSVLEGASVAASVQVINLCGRQRMLSQRVAKQALLASLLEGASADAARVDAGRAAQAFEAALQTLKAAPLSTAEIRAALGSADDQWRRMLQGVAEAGTQAGRLRVADAGEALLALFDDLTGRYEHSMQVLMG